MPKKPTSMLPTEVRAEISFTEDVEVDFGPPPPAACTVTIAVPVAAGAGNANVKTPANVICAKGQANDTNGQGPIEAWAKNYANDPGMPTITPDVGAVAGAVNTMARTWVVDPIPNAACNNMPPFPIQWVVVWCKFQDNDCLWCSSVRKWAGACSAMTDCGT
jgi:hypothetical protein